MLSHGIDPGRTGARVVIEMDGQTIVHVQKWKAPRSATPEASVPALDGIEPGDVVAIEHQYVGQSAHSSMRLLEWTMRMLLELERIDGLHITRPLGTTWRSKVLRNGRLSREVAKRLAIAAAAPHLARFGDPPDTVGDVSEAWCMARYGVYWFRAGCPE